MQLDPAALSALKNNQRQLDMDGCEVAVSRQALEELIAAYEALTSATPPDVAGLVEAYAADYDYRADNGCGYTPTDGERAMLVDFGYGLLSQAATALRLSAGGGWRSMDSAPQGPAVLLDLGETIPDLVDARVGQYITEADAAELGETLSASGGWIIWNSGDDWFVVPFDNAHGWQPLPASPTVEAGHVE